MNMQFDAVEERHKNQWKKRDGNWTKSDLIRAAISTGTSHFASYTPSFVHFDKEQRRDRYVNGA